MVKTPPPTETASGVLIASLRGPGRRLAHMVESSVEPENSSLNVSVQPDGLSVTGDAWAVPLTPDQFASAKRPVTARSRCKGFLIKQILPRADSRRHERASPRRGR